MGLRSKFFTAQNASSPKIYGSGRQSCPFVFFGTFCSLLLMSRAFVKEDVDPPERSGRKRAASGLPPGAANYMTARGAARLREKLAELQRDEAANADRIADLKGVLDSVTVVGPPAENSESVSFGAIVSLRGADENLESYRIVGVDELDLESNSVSWISPVGRALLAADVGEYVTLEGRRLKIVKAEYAED